MKFFTPLFSKTTIFTKIIITLFAIFLFARSFSQVTWVQVPSPDTSATRNMLRGISGTSSSDVWAVGSFEEVHDFNPYYVEKDLIMHWNGSAWKIFPPLNLSITYNDLWDVESISTNNVWAVGTYNDFSTSRAELLHYNGSSWAKQSLPFITGGSFLFSLDANSATDIWAVGGKAGSPTSPCYAIHYNGSSWNEIPVPPVGIYHNLFNAVDGITASDVWAVGYRGEHKGDYHTLAMHWNGSAWSNFPLPAVIENDDAELLNVEMISSNDVWAVGSSLTGGLIMVHWDGSNWSVAPHIGGGGAFAAIASNDLFAVGGEISHWDGNAWTIVDPLNQLSYPSLGATVVFSNGDIWADGRTVDAHSNFHTLVYRSVNGCAAPAVFITAGGPTAFCMPGSVTLTAVTQDSVSYHWKRNGVLISGAKSSTFVATTTGNYTVKAFNACGSAISNSITVTANPLPDATINPSGTINVCVGSSVKLSVTSSANQTYQWEKNNVNISGATKATYRASGAGSFTVSVSNTLTGCSATSAATIVKKITCAAQQTVTTTEDKKNQSTQSDFSIYPNPSQGNFTITLPADIKKDFTVSIYDQTGKLIYQNKYNAIGSGLTISLNGKIENGIYNLEISSNGNSRQQKLIIQQ